MNLEKSTFRQFLEAQVKYEKNISMKKVIERFFLNQVTLLMKLLIV